MNPELYQRLKPLYNAALDLPAELRAAFILEECGDDRELQRHLEALLAANEESSTALDSPLVTFVDFDPPVRRTLADGELVLGRFRIVRLIGWGGMGEVYEAEDRFLRGVNIALKTILPNFAGDPDLRKRFEREVLLAREVTHPNLCPIHTIFHCDDPPPGYLFLTMKLLPGETLAARLLKSIPMTSDEGLAVLRQASMGIATIHAAGILHRDIKPNNIIVDGNGPGLRLWITDFGLARAYDAETNLSTVGKVAGTPGYIAPELFLGHPYSQASDLFALGVVLHEVFAGEKPTPVPGTHSCTASPRLASSRFPPLGVHLITECLQDDPDRRNAAFANALEIIDPKLDRSRYTRRPRRFWTRRRFVTTVAAGVSGVAAATWMKWDDLENVLHPLPPKRFVALLNWPKTSDTELTPMLTGVLSAIKSELSRLEAFDRDLFIISPEDSLEDISKALASAHLKDICDPLGANLVLAASASLISKHFQLLLQLLDPSSNQVLREKTIVYPQADITSVPGKAVNAAGSLLNLSQYLGKTPRVRPGTHSTAAFAAFQSAEAHMNEPNDTGLDAAIEKYKQAVELDPQYALAHAELAEAYVHAYGIHHDPALLELARGNCEHALALDSNLVDAHLARAVLLERTGHEQSALDEFRIALALDPSNSETLVDQAQVFVRLNRWADAERTYERLIELRPNSWVTYNEKGVVLAVQGRYREAVQAFRTATIASPKCALAFANLGGSYLEIGDYREAEESSKKSMALISSSLAAVNISQALRYQGKAHDALPYALKSVELDPADDTHWLEVGDCYTAMGNRVKEAREAYLSAAHEAKLRLVTDATDGPKWMLFTLYKVKSGDLRDALSLIQRAESHGCRDLPSQLCKARVLELIGKRDEALATIAACFRRGASDLQIAEFPDLQALRKDERYLELVKSSPASAS